MGEPDTQAMIDWLQRSIEECDKSVAYYQAFPEEDKTGYKQQNYKECGVALRGRIVYWQELLERENASKDA